MDVLVNKFTSSEPHSPCALMLLLPLHRLRSEPRMVSLESSTSETPSAVRSSRSVKFSTTLTCTKEAATAAPDGKSGKSAAQPKSCLKRPAEVSEADVDSSQPKPSSVSKKAKKSLNARKHLKWLKRRKKKIRSRKARKTAAAAAAKTGDRLQDALAYLTDWYEHPETWKFKKLLQVTLIKHAFDAELINDDVFELFLHYLAGMQGKSIDRLTALCHRLIENKGHAVDPSDPVVPRPSVEAVSASADCVSPTDHPTDSAIILNRAKRMLEFLQPL
ncbi:hypothetical protein AAHC03_025914 [Spirometra sp. Aus1]